MIKRVLVLVACIASSSQAQIGRVTGGQSQRACETAGLQLPAGFCATIFAESIDGARHIVVAPNGDVFINTQASAPARPAPGSRRETGSIVGLRDTDRDGRADSTRRFGVGGGTGIVLSGNSLYATAGNSIVRYRVPSGSLTAVGRADRKSVV